MWKCQILWSRDRGIQRPRPLNLSSVAASGSVFSNVCLRKLYVLSSRGDDFQGSQTHLLQIARVRLLHTLHVSEKGFT